jgi:hypothetical protein
VRPRWRLRRGLTSTKSDRSDGLSRFSRFLHEELTSSHWVAPGAWAARGRQFLAEEVDPLPRAGVKAHCDCAAASPGASGMTAPYSDAVGSPTSAPTLSIAAPRISCARSRSSAIPR